MDWMQIKNFSFYPIHQIIKSKKSNVKEFYYQSNLKLRKDLIKLIV